MTELIEFLVRALVEDPEAVVVEELEEAFSTQGLGDDVLAFVELAGKQRWLAWD